MLRVVDLRCAACSHVEMDVYCAPDKHPPCTKCGGEMLVYWGATNARPTHADAFSPIVFGGVTYSTREDWAQARKEWKQLHGQELEVRGDSRRERLARLEEAHHATIREQSRRGDETAHRIIRDIERAGARIRR